MIVRCSRDWFAARCRTAGRTPEECERCVVGDDGRTLRVDADHADYPRPGLGDRVAAGLAAVGITEDRVARVAGKSACGGCKRRRERLNELGKAVGFRKI